MCTQIYIGCFKSIYFFMISVEIVYNMTKKYSKWYYVMMTTLFRCISNQCCSCYILKIKLYIIHVFKRSELTLNSGRFLTTGIKLVLLLQNHPIRIVYVLDMTFWLEVFWVWVLKSFITIRPDQVFY